jgi:hypothetical protein
MLKHLSIFSAAVVVHLAMVATTASADPILASASGDKLIVKDAKIKLDRPNNLAPADLQSIRQTLTQFYRGLNEASVTRISKVSTLEGRDRHQLEALFSQIKSYGVDWSIEVTSIELVSFYNRNAVMQVTELHKFSGNGRVANREASTMLRLSKLSGRWQVTGINSDLGR